MNSDATVRSFLREIMFNKNMPTVHMSKFCATSDEQVMPSVHCPHYIILIYSSISSHREETVLKDYTKMPPLHLATSIFWTNSSSSLFYRSLTISTFCCSWSSQWCNRCRMLIEPPWSSRSQLNADSKLLTSYTYLNLLRTFKEYKPIIVPIVLQSGSHVAFFLIDQNKN